MENKPKEYPRLPEDPEEFQRVFDTALERLKEKDRPGNRVGVRFLTGPKIGVIGPKGESIFMPHVLLEEIYEVLRKEESSKAGE